MANKTLYQINLELLNLVQDFENQEEGEFDNSMFDKLNLDFNQKLSNVAMVVKEFEGATDVIDAEIKRLTALKKSKQSTVEKLKNYIKRALQSQGIDKLDLDLFKFSFRESKSLVIVDESKIPKQYKIAEMVVSTDNAAIKSLLEEKLKEYKANPGDKPIDLAAIVPGATLEIKSNLQIR